MLSSISQIHTAVTRGSPLQISIVMPAYNAERFLAEAIESALAQTWSDFELIILDDGSQDRTREIAQSYALRDSRIRVESHENMGVSPTLNRGLALSANEWVAVMHADDVMMPNRLERQLAFLAAHPELDVASSWIRHIDSQGRMIARGESPLVTHEAVQALYQANKLIAFSHPAAILRKNAVLAVGGYRQAFWPAEDVDLWNRLVEKGYKILVQPEYLLNYRMHGNAASISGARLTRTKVRWLKDCMLHRRAGMPELDLESFLLSQRSAPLLTRLNRERKDLAKIFYKAAVMHYAQREYPALIIKLLPAMLLQPGYTIRQVLKKLVFRVDE